MATLFTGGILSFKVLSLAVSLLSVLLMLMKTSSVPVLMTTIVADILMSEVPRLHNFLLYWLQPPYLYVLVNFIIVSIVASSKLQLYLHNKAADEEEFETILVHPPPPPPDCLFCEAEDVASLDAEAKGEGQKKPVPVVTPLALASASARLPPRRKAGKALGVNKPKRQDTLESTWKAITDGRSIPLTRHLKKSDTWEARPRLNDENVPPPFQEPAMMKKLETFSDGVWADAGPAVSNIGLSSLKGTSLGSGRLRREPSLGQDELNRRVEAFINKFNEEMRLQRQESLNHYQEMIQRGLA